MEKDWQWTDHEKGSQWELNQEGRALPCWTGWERVGRRTRLSCPSHVPTNDPGSTVGIDRGLKCISLSRRMGTFRPVSGEAPPPRGVRSRWRPVSGLPRGRLSIHGRPYCSAATCWFCDFARWNLRALRYPLSKRGAVRLNGGTCVEDQHGAGPQGAVESETNFPQHSSFFSEEPVHLPLLCQGWQRTLRESGVDWTLRVRASSDSVLWASLPSA